MTPFPTLAVSLVLAAAWAPPARSQEASTAPAAGIEAPKVSSAAAPAPEAPKPAAPQAHKASPGSASSLLKAPLAGDAKEVYQIIEKTVNSLLAILQDKTNDRDARRKKIFAVMDSVGDFALMGKLTLGPAHWPKFDEAQRKEFIDLFAKAIRDSCFEKLDIYTNETVELDAPAPTDKGKFAMPVTVLSKGQRYAAIFKLYKTKAGWKTYDIEAEGISFVRTYAAQYDQVLEKGSPRDLLDKMRSKALATPDAVKNLAEPSKPAQERKP
jgi:ABC-type transporter MlaC component